MTNDQIIVFQAAIQIICNKQFQEAYEDLSMEDIQRKAVDAAHGILTFVEEVVQ
jgi:hypothetical protein